MNVFRVLEQDCGKTATMLQSETWVMGNPAFPSQHLKPGGLHDILHALSASLLQKQENSCCIQTTGKAWMLWKNRATLLCITTFGLEQKYGFVR